MDMPIRSSLPTPAPSPDARQAARSLGQVLLATPEYQAFLEALTALEADLDVQRIGVEMREHQLPIQMGRDADRSHAAALQQLGRELEEMPAVRKYRWAESAVRQLLLAVDEIVTQEAGLPFAANAKRSGCSCGG